MLIQDQTYSTDGTKYSVNKLIECSRNLPIVEIPLEALAETLEAVCWYEDGVTPAPRDWCSPIGAYEHQNENAFCRTHVERAMKADLNFPILLHDNNIVADGAHRLLKAYIMKEKTIRAKVFPTLPEEAKISS